MEKSTLQKSWRPLSFSMEVTISQGQKRTYQVEDKTNKQQWQIEGPHWHFIWPLREKEYVVTEHKAVIQDYFHGHTT